MDNLIKTIEQFLAYSDEKLEELAEKNQALREQQEERLETWKGFWWC